LQLQLLLQLQLQLQLLLQLQLQLPVLSNSPQTHVILSEAVRELANSAVERIPVFVFAVVVAVAVVRALHPTKNRCHPERNCSRHFVSSAVEAYIHAPFTRRSYAQASHPTAG